jgi:hypothetical protein
MKYPMEDLIENLMTAQQNSFEPLLEVEDRPSS